MAQLTPGARGSFEISDLRGVDFSSSPMEVNRRRASRAVNFINKDGITQKRAGWAQQCRIQRDGVPQRINGIFDYVDGAHREVLVHAGCRLYRMETDEDGRYRTVDVTESGTYAPAAVDATRLRDVRSQAFLRGGRLYWIGAGDYLVYGSWDGGQSFELRRVYDNEDTYIPKTTINIGHSGEDIRGTLDNVNYMTGWRRNGLTGLPSEQQPGYRTVEYYLDTTIDEGTEVIIRSLGSPTYEYRTNPTESPDNSGNRKLRLVNAEGEQFSGGYVNYEKGYVRFRTNNLNSTGEYYRVPGLMGESGDDVAEVIFYHREEGYEERVARCGFGILFGTSGNTDRLFLSGNPDFKNVDFYSAMDDYTYFEDVNTVTMGSDSYAVIGYARLSDNTLAIFKEKSQSEASIFYRTGYYKEFYNSDGSLDEAMGIFPTTAGNVGETVISRHACADFGGDSLILSENGVFGIALSQNVATAARFTRERSIAINARLRAESDLSSAVAAVYKGRYYLAVNGHCYVADARYRYDVQEALDGAYQYEWWYLEGIPARVFSELDGALWFGDADGRLCCFDEQFSDRVFTDLPEGATIFDDVNNCIVYGEGVASIADGDRIRFYTEGLYALVAANFAAVEGERIKTDENTVLHLYDGAEVFADGVGLAAGAPYVIDGVDVGDCTFRLLGADEEVVAPTSADFRLCRRISGGEYFVVLHDEERRSFCLSDEMGGAAIDLVLYNGATAILPTARVTRARAVKAEWVSAISDLGSAEYTKRLTGMTVVARAGRGQRVRFGYESRFGLSIDNEYGGSDAFSWDEFSFKDFSFDSGFARSYSVRLAERHVNFVAMRVLSEDDGPCQFERMSMQYEVNRKSRGVM